MEGQWGWKPCRPKPCFQMSPLLAQSSVAVGLLRLMSAIVLTVIPILLLYIFARRSLVRGLMGVGGK